MDKTRFMNSIESVTLQDVEVQQNGIIRNEKGRLIGRLVEDVEFESEHVKGLKRGGSPATNGEIDEILHSIQDGHENLLKDLAALLDDAQNYQFHDLKNTGDATPKMTLNDRLNVLMYNTIHGKYDN